MYHVQCLVGTAPLPLIVTPHSLILILYIHIPLPLLPALDSRNRTSLYRPCSFLFWGAGEGGHNYGCIVTKTASCRNLPSICDPPARPVNPLLLFPRQTSTRWSEAGVFKSYTKRLDGIFFFPFWQSKKETRCICLPRMPPERATRPATTLICGHRPCLPSWGPLQRPFLRYPRIVLNTNNLTTPVNAP